MRLIRRWTKTETSSPKMAASVDPRVRPPITPTIRPRIKGRRPEGGRSLTLEAPHLAARSLHPHDKMSLLPQLLELVVVALFGAENMHNHIAEVEQDPPIGRRTFAPVRRYLDRVQGFLNGQWNSQVLANLMFDWMFRGGGDFGRGATIAIIIMIAVIPIMVWNIRQANKETGGH